MKRVVLLSLLFALASSLPSWYALQEQLLDGCSTNYTLMSTMNNLNGAADSKGRVWVLGGRAYCGDTNQVFSSPVLRYYDINVGHWTVVWTYGDSDGPLTRNDNFIWVDKFDNLWIYGGLDEQLNRLCDFWMYNTTSGLWTDKTPLDTSATFNDRGVESDTTYPGCLGSSAVWYTHDDHSLWLTHGYRSMAFGEPAMFRYNINSGKWTWMAGSNTTQCTQNQFPDSGSSFNNYPCMRYAPLSAVDDKGNLWFFGGDMVNEYGNDLWKFDRAAGWARLPGGRQQESDAFTPSYGNEGEFSEGAWPFGATYSSMTYAGNNILALKGGYANENGDYTDEDWYYNITSGLWMNAYHGTYETVIKTLGQADPLNRPGTNKFSRVSSVGALWVIGDKTGSVFVKKLSCDTVFNPCNEHATCTPDPWTAATCTCNEGYTGTGFGADGCTMTTAPDSPSSTNAPASGPSSTPSSTTPSAVPKGRASTASQCGASIVAILMFFALC